MGAYRTSSIPHWGFFSRSSHQLAQKGCRYSLWKTIQESASHIKTESAIATQHVATHHPRVCIFKLPHSVTSGCCIEVLARTRNCKPVNLNTCIILFCTNFTFNPMQTTCSVCRPCINYYYSIVANLNDSFCRTNLKILQDCARFAGHLNNLTIMY